MMSQLAGGVEVKTASGAWLSGATIVDYNPDQIPQMITVSFEETNIIENYPIESVRFAAPLTADNFHEFSIGDEIELSRLDEHSGRPGWFTGKIANVKGGFFVCDFELDETTTKDVVDASDLRVPNQNSGLSVGSFFRTAIELPDDVHSYCQSRPDEHKDFLKACEAMSVKYYQGKLIILSQTNIERRVDMLKEFHIRNLQQKNKIDEKMTDLTKTLEESKLVAEAAVEKFEVDRDLLKFVVGSKGSNIQAARKIKGVMKVEIDDENSTVSIYAEDEDCAARARKLLEFSHEYYLVPRRLVGRIIGQKGKLITDILDKTGLLKVKIMAREDCADLNIEGVDDPDMTPFKFIGRMQSCTNAKTLMDYLIQSHKELDTLQSKSDDIQGEIRQYRPGFRSTANSSGYNSETSPKTETRKDQRIRPKRNENVQKGRKEAPRNKKQGEKDNRKSNNTTTNTHPIAPKDNYQSGPALTLNDFIEVKPKKKGYARAVAKPIGSSN